MLMTPLNFGAVILAAGRSTRMGRPKQLLKFRGKSMLEHAIYAALGAGIRRPVVVLGASADTILSDIQVLENCNVVNNEDFKEGQAASLRAGTLNVAGKCDAAIFMLVDQPLIDSKLVLSLLDNFNKIRPDLLYPVYENQRGNPVVISASLFPRLLTIKGDEGARSLFNDSSLKICACEVNSQAVITDVDTWYDYISLFKS